MLRLITTIALLITSLAAQADFVQDRDLISLHYDHAPDRDDGHATVAALSVVRKIGITPHVVSGAYGTGNRDEYQPAAVAVMQAAWGSEWVDAHANWQNAVNETAARWNNTLANGGDIWVAEGGQSDFTSDVIRSIKNSNSSVNTNNRIHVVQHSTWNENQSNQADLNYSRSNTDYLKIADGNGVNATADLNEKSSSFVQLARASAYSSAWNAAFSYLNPNNKLDFSDTVELLYILGIGKDQIATVDEFGAVYLDNTPTALATSPTAWSDSYSVDGQCYCDTSFDHGLDSISVDTPTGSRSVPQICADITSTFGSGSFENRVYFNTVQCGHGPANNSSDETVCPGIPRGLNDYTGTRCNQTGATWNLDSLYPQAAVVVPEPVVVVEPQAAQTSVPTVPVTIDGFPVCSATLADDNGDGYGWENFQTCVFATASIATEPAQATQTLDPIDNPLINFPVCSSSVIDYNGDGYEWENNQTCVVDANSSTEAPAEIPVQAEAVQPQANLAPIDNPLVNFPVCSSSVIDYNGDGYEWENNQTCVVDTNATTAVPAEVLVPTQENVAPIDNPLVYFPVCSNTIIDDNGDGYGWENYQTCVVPSETSAVNPTATQTTTPVENPLINFPVCSGSVIDFNGDGYEWENNQTCVIDGNALVPQTVTPVVNPEASVTLLEFPLCSATVIDVQGDGYGWENNQTCILPATAAAQDASLVTFPVCSDNIIDENGDGFGWENGSSCAVVPD